MIVDAMMLAEPCLHMSQMIDNPKEYINLTDSILREIERSKDPKLEASRKIMKRIRDRDIYKFVDEYHYSQEESKMVSKEKSQEIAAKISSYRNSNSVSSNFNPDDVIVEILKVNYAMKDKNPVDSIKFYSKYDGATSLSASSISREKISALIPDHYEDTVCRVFSKNPETTQQIQEAFRSYLSQETHARSMARKRTSSDSEFFAAAVNGTKSPPWNNSLTIPQDFTASPRKRVLPSSMNTSPVKKVI